MDYQNANIMAAHLEDYIYKKKNVTVKINRSCFSNQRQYLLLCQAYQTVINDKTVK